MFQIYSKHKRATSVNKYDGMKWEKDFLTDMLRIKKFAEAGVRIEEDWIDHNYYRFIDDSQKVTTVSKNRIKIKSKVKNSAYNLINKLNIKVVDMNPLYFSGGQSNVS